MDLFQVKELMNVQVRNLSLGERMKMELIVALLHAGMGFYTMISYYIISSYLFQLDKSSEISHQMTSMLRNGTFSKYMVIPVHTQAYFVAMVTGKILFSACIGFFTTILCFYFLGISFVSAINIKILFCGVIMIVLGLLFMAELNYFLGILTLKFEEISTFLMIKDNFLPL